MANTGISIVILTYNCEKPIKQLLDGFFKINTYAPIEFIVIDHGSTDRTLEVVANYASFAFIRTIRTNGKRDYASSVNLGASKARYPYLLFLNSGIKYSKDIIPIALKKLNAPEIGVVGVLIEDDRGTRLQSKLPGNFYTGIRFEWHDELLYFHPKPIKYTRNQIDRLQSSLSLSVSSHFLLCRGENFTKLNGFCEEYQNCLEDIDFCLNMSKRLKLKCWCINDLSLKVSHDTLNKFSSTLEDASVQKSNADVFRRRMADYICRSFISFPQRRNTHTELHTATNLNVLFVVCDQSDRNSVAHVQLHAARLISSGAKCRIAVPNNTPTTHSSMSQHIISTFDNIENNGITFEDDRGPDVIYAWTPKEPVRKLCETLLNKFPSTLIVHIEKDEAYFAASKFNKEYVDLEKVHRNNSGNPVPNTCYHPTKGRRFIDSAHGITLEFETLSYLNPKNIPSKILLPPVDESLFFPRPINFALRKKWGIPKDHLVIGYVGNVYKYNHDKAEELYRAVNYLNQNGYPTTIIRIGSNFVSIRSSTDLSGCEKNLGDLKGEKIADTLAAADILVKPGNSSAFDNQRIPFMLLEYFTLGRPVILDSTYSCIKIKHREDAYILDEFNQKNICNALIEIQNNKNLAEKLSKQSVEYFLENISKPFTRNSLYGFLLSFQSQKKYVENDFNQARIKKSEHAIETKKHFIVEPKQVIRPINGVKRYSSGIDLGEQSNYYYGKHRFGWASIVKSLLPLNDYRGIYFDTFIERSMIWGENAPVLIDRDWIGVLHNPPYIPEFFKNITNNINFEDLINCNSVFRTNLRKCCGLVTLSKHHKHYVQKFVDIPVISILHPTEFITTEWDYQKFESDQYKQVVQVGWWLRKLHGIYMLKVDRNRIQKIYLSKDEPQITQCFLEEEKILKQKGLWKDEMRSTVRFCNFLSNSEYDKLLTKAVVFLNLYDSSANNTIVECITRNTPILINKIPPVIEYLGASYPLYYESFEEASEKIHDNSLVLAAHIYLKDLDKDALRVDSFARDVSEFANNIIEKHR